MAYNYQIKNSIWQPWPLKPRAGYMQGENHGFINYGMRWLRDDLTEELTRLDLIQHCVLSVFYTAPNKPMPIHVDGFSSEKKRRANAAINWTWTENKNEPWKMVWYDFPNDPNDMWEHYSNHDIKNGRGETHNTEYSYTRFNESKMIATYQAHWTYDDNPQLLRTNVPHNIVMDNPDTARWCASIRFGFPHDENNTMEDFDMLKNLFDSIYK